MSDFTQAALAAPAELHVVLQAWFNAQGSDDPATVLAHFAPGFHIVSPAGKVLSRANFATALPSLRGSRVGLLMEISDVTLRHLSGDTAVVTYLERQTQGESVTNRFSTVVLTSNQAGGPALWTHLQETWLA